MSGDTDVCDACGEAKPLEGGESWTSYDNWPDDEPVIHWICADCVKIGEEQEIAREEARIDDYYDRK